MTTKVVPVTVTPKQFILTINGVPTLERARLWGEKQGFSVVEWHKRMERAYGIARSASPDVKQKG